MLCTEIAVAELRVETRVAKKSRENWFPSSSVVVSSTLWFHSGFSFGGCPLPFEAVLSSSLPTSGPVEETDDPRPGFVIDLNILSLLTSLLLARSAISARRIRRRDAL